MNALRGAGTGLPQDSMLADAQGRNHSQQAFRDKLIDQLHGMTGIKPTLQPSTDGSSYSISL
jgi:hypothetical protein